MCALKSHHKGKACTNFLVITGRHTQKVPHANKAKESQGIKDSLTNLTTTGAMDFQNTSQRTTPIEIMVNVLDTVSPIIQFFAERITPQQWRQLKSGDPDFVTKLRLAEMVLDVIVSVSGVFEERLGCSLTQVSEEAVRSNLKDTIHQSLEDILGTSEQVGSTHSEQLVLLLSEEVAETVNCVLGNSSSHSGQSSPRERITPPHKVNAMVDAGCKLFQDFADKAEVMCEARPASLKTEDPEELCLDPDRVASKDSFVKATSHAAQNIIRREVQDLIEPIFDGDSSQYKLLLSKTSDEIQDIAFKVSPIMEANLKSHGKPLTKFKGYRETVRRKLKSLFSRTVFKALTQRMLSQVRRNSDQDSSASESETLESLLDDILPRLQSDEQQDGNELPGSKLLEDISSGKVLAFSQTLTDLLYEHATEGMFTPAAFTTKAASRTEAACSRLHDVIQKDVWIFLAIMSWWEKTQGDAHSKMVTLALTGHEEEEVVITPRSRAVKETFVKILLGKLITRILKKSKTELPEEKKAAIFERLFEILRTELEGVHFSTKSMGKLDKPILKALIEKFGHLEKVLFHIKSTSPEMITALVATFKDHLTSPRTGSPITSFFSSFFRVLSKPFTAPFKG